MSTILVITTNLLGLDMAVSHTLWIRILQSSLHTKAPLLERRRNQTILNLMITPQTYLGRICNFCQRKILSGRCWLWRSLRLLVRISGSLKKETKLSGSFVNKFLCWARKSMLEYYQKWCVTCMRRDTAVLSVVLCQTFKNGTHWKKGKQGSFYQDSPRLWLQQERYFRGVGDPWTEDKSGHLKRWKRSKGLSRRLSIREIILAIKSHCVAYYYSYWWIWQGIPKKCCGCAVKQQPKGYCRILPGFCPGFIEELGVVQEQRMGMSWYSKRPSYLKVSKMKSLFPSLQ